MQTRRLHFIIFAATLTCSVPLAAPAAVVNGSFETGTFTGWNTIGDTSIQTSAIGVAPTDGTSMALLTTLCGLMASCDVIEIPFSTRSAVEANLGVLQGFFGYSQAEIASRNLSTRMRHGVREFTVAGSAHFSRRTGSVNVNVEPTPTALVTQIFPPWSSMNFRESASPSPVPSTFLSAVPTCRNSSKTAS